MVNWVKMSKQNKTKKKLNFIAFDSYDDIK